MRLGNLAPENRRAHVRRNLSNLPGTGEAFEKTLRKACAISAFAVRGKNKELRHLHGVMLWRKPHERETNAPAILHRPEWPALLVLPVMIEIGVGKDAVRGLQIDHRRKLGGIELKHRPEIGLLGEWHAGDFGRHQPRPR
jgi:hypothetical protein